MLHYIQVYMPFTCTCTFTFASKFVITDTFYATRLKFGMTFTETKTLDFMIELPLGGARGQNVKQVILNTCRMATES